MTDMQGVVLCTKISYVSVEGYEAWYQGGTMDPTYLDLGKHILPYINLSTSAEVTIKLDNGHFVLANYAKVTNIQGLLY